VPYFLIDVVRDLNEACERTSRAIELIVEV